MLHTYGYKVKYFVEQDPDIVTDRGLTMASSYGDAIEKLVEMYGEDELNDINIYFIEDCVTVITEETIRELVEQWENEDEALEKHN